jgi:hypothetical protein
MEISENASQISSDFVAAFERARPAGETFKRLADQWHSECLLSSSVTEICTNMAYQQIIGLGAEALPFIFRELQKEPDHWSWALQAITGENPVPRSAAGDLKAMASAWLEWARRNRYL